MRYVPTLLVVTPVAVRRDLRVMETFASTSTNVFQQHVAEPKIVLIRLEVG